MARSRTGREVVAPPVRRSRLVCYSYVATDDRGDEHAFQFGLSVGSLRLHNPQVPAVLFVHGSLPSAIQHVCRRHGVMVHPQGSYVERLARACPGGAGALAHYPVLHKNLNFREIATARVDQVLCCDLDTIFFADVDHLFDRYASAADVVAREEVFSGRSIHGADSVFIDEALLARLAAHLGRSVVPPFNLGMVLYNERAVGRLPGVMETFVDDAWRLLSGLACGSPLDVAMGDRASFPWIDAVAASLTARDVQRALPFPSSNGWIVEEVALWLALGILPGLTTSDFSPHDVAQNGEMFGHPPGEQTWLACHYYSHNLSRVVEWLPAMAAPLG